MKNFKKILIMFIITICLFFFTSCDNKETDPNINIQGTSAPQENVASNVFSGIYLEYDTYTYDGSPKGIYVKGDLPYDAYVSYSNNKNVNAGKYEMSATISCKGYKTETLYCSYEILKADYDLSNIKFLDKIFSYDGTEKSLAIEGTLPKGVTVSYSNNKLIEQGKTIVTASFSHNNPNYNAIPSKKATLEVKYPTANLDNISFTDKTYVYDGTEKTLAIEGTLPEGVEVTYSPNKLTQIGTIEVTATFTVKPGYKLNIANPILKATLTIDSVFAYETYLDGYMVSKYRGNEVQVTVPSTYNGKPVLKIGFEAFKNNKTLNKLYLPDSIIEIGRGAFYGCSNLGHVRLSNNLVNINSYGFAFCHNIIIENNRLPQTVKFIGAHAFYCHNLKTLYVPSGATVEIDGIYQTTNVIYY